MGVLDELVAFVRSADADALPERDRAVLRRHTADVVAARMAGAACSEGRAVSAFYLGARGATTEQTRSAEQIAGLATLVRLTETDDFHLATGTTPSSVAASVALALAASSSCGASRLESAILVALELLVRLGKAAGGAGIFYKGIWPTRAGAALGAAAAASRVWGLDGPATRNALALAVLVTSGRTGQFVGQPSGRWFVFASSVAAGIRAAEAARAGFRGDPGIVENGGLSRALGVEVDVRSLGDGLGGSSVLPELSLKPYCTSRQALPGAEAMRAVVAAGVDPDDITRFTIRVPSAYAGMIGQKIDPSVRSSAYVSGAGVAAIAAIDADWLYDVERERALSSPRVRELAAKGEVTADPELDALYPEQWPARLEVVTRHGRHDIEVLAPQGDPANAMSDAQLSHKVQRMLVHAQLETEQQALAAVTRTPFASDEAAASLARYFVRGGR